MYTLVLAAIENNSFGATFITSHNEACQIETTFISAFQKKVAFGDKKKVAFVRHDDDAHQIDAKCVLPNPRIKNVSDHPTKIFTN